VEVGAVSATGPGLIDSYELDLSVLPLVERMQWNGIAVDRLYFREYAEELTEKIFIEVAQIHALTGLEINPNSPDQAADLIYNHLGMDSSKAKKSKKTGKLSTNKKSVEALRTLHKAIDHLVTARELSKARDSFAQPIADGEESGYTFRFDRETGLYRLRCTLRLTRVSSGRLAASGPNLMAIPVRTKIGLGVRKGFIAAPGRRLYNIDLDQVEMRVMADQSLDQDMCLIFNEAAIPGKFRDIHNYTAARMYKFLTQRPSEMSDDDWECIKTTKEGGIIDKNEHRYPAKRVGFGVITGIQGLGLLDQMRMAGLEGWTEETCDELIVDYLQDIFPGVKAYMDRCRYEAQMNGVVAEPYGGRVRYLPGAGSELANVSEEAKRQSHSHKIQGGAQTLMKRGMVRCWREVLPEIHSQGYYCEPIIQVHDAMLFEVDEDAIPILDAMMEEVLTDRVGLGVPEFAVPLGAKGGHGVNWAEID
jgi:DNA polymerase-1